MIQNSDLNSVMEARNHFKNGAGLKSHTGRRNILIFAALMLLGMMMFAPVHAQISIVPENAKPPKKNNQKPYYQFILRFESNLKDHGYTKQNTLWDLVSPNMQEAYLNRMDYAQVVKHLIGIWVNFKDELVMFRTNGDIMAELQVVPFDQIAEVRIKIDAYEETKTRGGGTSVLSGAIGIGSANTRTVSQEKVKGAEVTVVTKSANGVKNYRINISGRNSVQAIRLVEDIADEIGFILNRENRKE